MRRALVLLLLALLVPLEAGAMEFTAPPVPEAGAELMPEHTDADGLRELVGKALEAVHPDLREASQTCLSVAAAVLLTAVLRSVPGSPASTAELAGTVAIAGALLTSADSLITLAGDTVGQMGEYGKLLLPVMTTALAAQGGLTSSTALYTGTAMFTAVLSSLISRLLVPGIYLYLALAAANSATGEGLLKRLRDLTRQGVSWALKMVLTVFTTYMGITGVVSGATDAAALKAARVTLSSVVPVVGGILSDASETILVSAGVMKNMAGLYGIFAVLALFLGPFLRIGCHYLLLKLTAGICGIFGSPRHGELVGDFSSAMGLLLAMTGSVCIMLLVSTVCFMKGVG